MRRTAGALSSCVAEGGISPCLGSANVLALLSMVKDLRARDKVICIAFGACAAFLLGDHLSFTANIQPTVIVPVLLGKLAGGICAILFANLLACRHAEELEAAEVAYEKAPGAWTL